MFDLYILLEVKMLTLISHKIISILAVVLLVCLIPDDESETDRIKDKIIGRIKKQKAILIGFMFLIILFTGNTCVSASMEPTIMTGDQSIAINTLFGYKPQRGDVVAFTQGNQLWIKRVIGLPGEMIVIKNNTVYIDGEPLEEDYLPEGTYTYSGKQSIYVVPEGKLLLLGDNREHSFDSRYWDDSFMPVSRVVAKHLRVLINIKKILPQRDTDLEDAIIYDADNT